MGPKYLDIVIWSYPNLHGDVTWTSNQAGALTGFYQYDPFGQPIDPASKVIGSQTADEAVPDTLPGSYDAGWVGMKGKGYEHLGSVATIEMGARMYVAGLGRFLGPDPIPGGNTSSYNYPNDPVNMFDLTGECSVRAAERGSCNLQTYYKQQTAAKSKQFILNSVNTSRGGYGSGPHDWRAPTPPPPCLFQTILFYR